MYPKRKYLEPSDACSQPSYAGEMFCPLVYESCCADETTEMAEPTEKASHRDTKTRR